MHRRNGKSHDLRKRHKKICSLTYSQKNLLAFFGKICFKNRMKILKKANHEKIYIYKYFYLHYYYCLHYLVDMKLDWTLYRSLSGSRMRRKRSRWSHSLHGKPYRKSKRHFVIGWSHWWIRCHSRHLHLRSRLCRWWIVDSILSSFLHSRNAKKFASTA